MLPETHTTKRTTLVSWAWVLLGCVLSLTSSTDLTVLADVLDRNLPSRGDCSASEADDDLDDVQVFAASACSADGRRGERKYSPICLVPRPEATLCRVPHSPVPFAISLGRPGSEHGLRNGLGVPLLC